MSNISMEQTMPAISSRLYEGEKDFQTMLDLMNKVRPASHANDYPVKVDIEESLANDLKKRYEGIADRLTLYTPFVSNEKDKRWRELAKAFD